MPLSRVRAATPSPARYTLRTFSIGHRDGRLDAIHVKPDLHEPGEQIALHGHAQHRHGRVGVIAGQGTRFGQLGTMIAAGSAWLAILSM